MDIRKPVGNKSIHVQRLEPITSRHSKNPFKLKIAEKDISLQSMNHNGIDYEVVKKYSRGRYIVRKVA